MLISTEEIILDFLVSKPVYIKTNERFILKLKYPLDRYRKISPIEKQRINP